MIAVIDYNAGNVRSVLFALDRLGEKSVLTDNPTVIQSADKVIFPGVGEASTTMNHLRSKGLDLVIKGLEQPVLGICLGMQLLCDHSEENDTTCLGIIPQNVKLFRPENGEKVPHIGWNTFSVIDNPLLTNELEGQYAYFVHSYYMEVGPYTLATTHYTGAFSAAVHKDNFWATQFHPEKSSKVGERILKNFLSI